MLLNAVDNILYIEYSRSHLLGTLFEEDEMCLLTDCF